MRFTYSIVPCFLVLTLAPASGQSGRYSAPEPPLPTHREPPSPPSSGSKPARRPPGPAPYPSLEREDGLPVRTTTAPAHHRFTLRLVGNRVLTEEQIRAAISEQLTAIEESGLTAASADDTAFFLGVHYRKLGYSQADVQWKILSGRTLQLTISEGPITHLGKITFHGNQTVPHETLSEIVTGIAKPKSPRAAQRHPAPTPYSESEIKSGVARVRGYYLSEGYLDSTVDAAEITLSPDKTEAEISINIYEGTSYRFGKIKFAGEIMFFPQEDLLKELEVFSKKPYTPLAVTNLERKVLFYYRSRGYFNAKVTSESNPAEAINGEVPITFYVDTGEPYLFGPIKQSGLRRLRPSFLENRFKSLQGQPYNPTVIDERYRHLISTGLFSDLKIKQNALPNQQVELEFQVEEAKSREVGFSIGYGSLEGGILGARYLDRNLFGFGRPVSFNAELAQRLLRGELVYTDPWVFDSNYTMRVRLYALTQDLFDYSKNESGLRGELSRRFGDHLEASVFVLSRVVNIYGTTIDPEELGKTDYFTNSIGTSLTLDYRDSALNPSKGWVINTTTDVATGLFGSSIEFFRSTLRASYYLPIGKTLLAVGARGGLIIPLNQDSLLPIDERFFNGGSRSVRSYQERSLGPRDWQGNAIGGETFTNFNIEDIFPIYGNLKGAVFFDAGSVGRKFADGFGTTGYAVGLGLRYDLPIGPVRIDYGVNPVRGENQPFGALHVSFGFAF